MKLLSARIRDFRCIEDSEEFRLDDITCLVGKNESGKSSILAALEKLNPSTASRGSFDKLDYPRRKWRPNEQIPNEPPAITTSWSIDSDDAAAFAERFGSNVLRSDQISVAKGYDNKLQLTLEIAEPALVGTLLERAGLTADDINEMSLSERTLEALQTAIATRSAASEAAVRLQAVLAELLPEGLETIHKWFLSKLPKFLYFGEYQKLSGQVSLDAYAQRKTAGKQSWSDLLFEALLQLAGTTPEAVQTSSTFEELNASLRAVSNQISSEIFQYWSQNRHLDVELRIDHARPSDPPPFNSGFIFRTRIDNRRHRTDTSFDDRSTGFVWFFSFLIWFSELKKRHGRNLVLLLDEPGLTLHARAQADLLRYFRERLKPQHQVIYTTHSPFMIDPDQVLSARTVEDVVRKDEVLGTKVGDRVLSRDPDTVSPLQRALDYELTQTLFVGRHTLLVEGPADFAYLKWFSKQLQSRQRTALDYRWNVCIVTGIDRIPGFVSIFRGNGLHIAALVDVSKKGKQQIEKVRACLEKGHLLTADTYAGKLEADFEDLFSPEFYAALVNAAYKLRGGDALTFDPARALERLVPQVDEHFRLLPERFGEFDHFRPAEWLIENDNEGQALPGFGDSLDRVCKLVIELNGLMPSS